MSLTTIAKAFKSPLGTPASFTFHLMDILPTRERRMKHPAQQTRKEGSRERLLRTSPGQAFPQFCGVLPYCQLTGQRENPPSESMRHPEATSRHH